MATASTASMFSSVYENLVESDVYSSTNEPIFILGHPYKLTYERELLEQDILSKLWFTYRKGFSAIGGSGPTSDVGWGCMLRCGQMMLAQALVNRHLTRGWRWKAGHIDLKYLEILKLFQDKKDCCYSIHQIASMGASEGKAVGEWFGPNTVVQVLRKLAVYDKWSNLVIHVAMDNSVIIEDICKLCETNAEPETGSNSSVVLSKFSTLLSSSEKQEVINGLPGVTVNDDIEHVDKQNQKVIEGWRPLLLVIPLRLGLSEINSTYFNAVKACFRLQQSVGIIGGKPSHAHWFIGYTENHLFYLDPHTVQSFVDLSKQEVNDESFHCCHPCHMDISELDPSIAVGFYCGSKSEFDDLCTNVNKFVIAGAKTPIFEMHQKRPPHFPPIQPYCLENISKKHAAHSKQPSDTDDEYEII